MAENPVQMQVAGVDEVRSLFLSLPESTFKTVKKVFTDSTLLVHKRVRARFDGIRLKTRSGAAKRSFKTKVTGTNLRDLLASVYSGGAKPLIYILTQEFGAQIKAKKAYKKVPGGPYLNIPLSSNQTASGITKLSPREVFQSGGFIFKSKKGNWLVANKQGTPMYVLKSKVNVPPRLGFFVLADREADKIPGRLSKLLPMAWEKGSG